MSRWTHIAGVVRIDSIGMLNPERAQWFQTLPERLQDGLPSGSEGPLVYSVLRDPAHGIETSLSQGQVYIWGDLRDFGGVDDSFTIVEWLDKHLTGNKTEMWFPRMGVVVVEDEGEEGSVVLQFEQSCEGKAYPHWHGWTRTHRHGHADDMAGRAK